MSLSVKELKVGDVIEYGRLFPAATTEPITMDIFETSEEYVKAVASFYGISLGVVFLRDLETGIVVEFEDE